MRDNIQPIPIPETFLTWNLYGSGLSNLGRDGNPERVTTPSPSPDQILVRIDSVGMCYSDVKLINQGGNHPKLKGRDLSSDPTRPGHEISFTIVAVGKDLADQYFIRDRFAVQPEVIINNTKFTYGFSISGGLTQYQLIGPELLCTDNGPSIKKIAPGFGYAEAALLEPWGSVLASYDNMIRRLIPKRGGKMWIIGNHRETHDHIFSTYLDYPESILISDLSGNIRNAVTQEANKLRQIDSIQLDQYSDLAFETTDGQGFDDIVVIDPQSANQIERLVSLINPGGVINLVGTQPLKEKVSLDAGRTHYDFISMVGNAGLDLAASYGKKRNRCEPKPNGTALLVGAGGPIGQMHLQLSISTDPGPRRIIIMDTHQERLEYVEKRYSKLAADLGKEIEFINPTNLPENREEIQGILGNIDDAIALIADPDVLELAASVLAEDGLLNIFAGAPIGTNFLIDISQVYLGNLQITGSSGLYFRHLEAAYSMARDEIINVYLSVAAVGGLEAAREALHASAERRFPGKIIIYPHLDDLPLMSIRDLAYVIPEIEPYLDGSGCWSRRAEAKLLELIGNY